MSHIVLQLQLTLLPYAKRFLLGGDWIKAWTKYPVSLRVSIIGVGVRICSQRGDGGSARLLRKRFSRDANHSLSLIYSAQLNLCPLL